MSARRTPAVLLSSILKSVPQAFDRNKVAAVEKFVNEIDLLPARYHEATVGGKYSPKGSKALPFSLIHVLNTVYNNLQTDSSGYEHSYQPSPLTRDTAPGRVLEQEFPEEPIGPRTIQGRAQPFAG